MEKSLDFATWSSALTNAVSELGASIAAFVPNLFGAALILILGWVLSRVLQALVGRGLMRMGLDRFAARLNIADLLERAEIQASVSQIIGKLVFWLVMLTFVLSSVETLGLTAVTETIDRLIGFIPNVVAAVLIGIAGLVFARFVGTLVRSAAAAADFLSPRRLGFLAQLITAGFVLAIAVDQLGIATEIFVLPFSVAIGTAGFGIGLAFALGSRPIITHIMAGHFLKQSLPRDAPVEIDGRRGVIERVGAVETTLRSDENSWTIPNAQLLETVVVR